MLTNRMQWLSAGLRVQHLQWSSSLLRTMPIQDITSESKYLGIWPNQTPWRNRSSLSSWDSIRSYVNYTTFPKRVSANTFRQSGPRIPKCLLSRNSTTFSPTKSAAITYPAISQSASSPRSNGRYCTPSTSLSILLVRMLSPDKK